MNGETHPLKERIFWVALALYLFVLPIANTIAIRNLAFIVLVAVTAAALVEARKLPLLPLVRYWLAYLLVALVSVFFAADPEMSLGELRVEVVYCMAVFFIGVTWGGRYRGFERFAVLLVLINLILTAAAFSVVSVDMPFEEILQIHPVAYAGMDGNWLLVVLFINSWLACCLWNSGRKTMFLLLAGLIVLDVWAMMATYNRQNLIALGSGIGAAALVLLSARFSWRRAAFFIGILAVVGALLAVQMLRRPVDGAMPQPGVRAPISAEHAGNLFGASASADVRWGLWKFSLGKIAEHPWIGGGIGRGVFHKLYPEYMPENAQLWHAHNMILNKGIQMGIPGMIVFAALWAALAMEMLRHARSPGASRYLATAGCAAIVAIFTKNLTDDFFVRNVALEFWLVMGLLAGFLRADAARASQRELPVSAIAGQ